MVKFKNIWRISDYFIIPKNKSFYHALKKIMVEVNKNVM